MSDDRVKLRLTERELRALEQATGLHGKEAASAFTRIALEEGIYASQMQEFAQEFAKRHPAKE